MSQYWHFFLKIAKNTMKILTTTKNWVENQPSFCTKFLKYEKI